jgi:uncharacterized cupredoxin-like copper-binding protein
MNSKRRWAAIIVCAALPLAGHAADRWAGATPLTVVMIDNRFEPSNLILTAGRPYALLLENHGKEMHEFTAPAFLKAAVVRDRQKLANGGTDIVVQPGKTVRVLLIAPAKGHYDLTCADHDWDGMVGTITVE